MDKKGICFLITRALAIAGSFVIRMLSSLHARQFILVKNVDLRRIKGSIFKKN